MRKQTDLLCTRRGATSLIFVFPRMRFGAFPCERNNVAFQASSSYFFFFVVILHNFVLHVFSKLIFGSLDEKLRMLGTDLEMKRIFFSLESLDILFHKNKVVTLIL